MTLSGSTVTGAFDKDSDLDLAVIVPDPEPDEKFNRIDRAVELRHHIRDINAEAGETVYERAG